MLSAAMNGFYGHKRLTGNEPATAAPSRARLAHGQMHAAAAAQAASPKLVPLRVAARGRPGHAA